MKKIYVFLYAVAAIGIAISVTSCNNVCKKGSGKQITETRTVTGFNKLDISGAYSVNIKQDSTESLTITADDNLMKYIKSEVSGDKLRIHSTKNMCGSGKFLLNISLRDLSELKASGSVDVSSVGKLNLKDFALGLSGSTKVTLDLSAANVSTSGAGLTEINLTGQATSHSIELSGSGHLDALDFVVGKYNIETSGLSDCKINVLSELNVNSSGASDIQYRGNPAKVNNSKSGASSMKKIE